MKRKKFFIFVIIIISVLSLTTCISLATDDVDTEIVNDENKETINTGNTDTESNNTENENINTEIDNTENNNNEENESSSQNNIENNISNEETTVYTVNSGPSTQTYYYNSNNNNKENIKSSNANLKLLNVNVEGMTPDFSKNNTEYYLVVDLTVEEIIVKAIPEDEKATVTVTGNKNIEEGQNTIQVVVKAEDGTIMNYYIYVTKTDDIEGTNANLKSLDVKGWSFYPQFKPNIYSYSLTINEKISKLDITAETENDEATFEIVGNENLQEGENIIKIIVTARDGETSREYKINTFISSKTVNVKQENKISAIVLIIVLGIAILITTVAIIKKK